MVGETFADRYELEELIGTSDLASVYRVLDSQLERHVALKILDEERSADPAFVARFRQEARAVAQLSHPNIATMIDRGEYRRHQFIVFEYVDGENLEQLLARRGPLPVDEAVEIALQSALGLAYAHGHGVVHGDVKPRNVLVNGDGRAKVTDFAFARALDPDLTSEFVAPEQAGGRTIDERADVYSLGAVLFDLLAGELPFSTDGEPGSRLSDLRPDVEPRLAAAVARAIEEEPDDRFPSMAAFALELQSSLAPSTSEEDTDASGTLVIEGSRERRHKRVSPWAVGLALVGLVALAAVVVGFVALRNHHKTPLGTPVAAKIDLRGISGYDPDGDHTEHDSIAPLATDGKTSTYWNTEHYQVFSKPGVGLLLDAGRPASPHGITVDTETPGFTAEIEAGNDRSGADFHRVSASRVVSGSTTFPLDLHSSLRYYVVWITKLPAGVESVELNEVRAS